MDWVRRQSLRTVACSVVATDWNRRYVDFLTGDGAIKDLMWSALAFFQRMALEHLHHSLLTSGHSSKGWFQFIKLKVGWPISTC